jgi:metallophosphoesterase (TIGR00282 family)
MKILICGDVVGRSGREAVLRHVSDLKRKIPADLVILNVDNAAHGFGVTKEIARQLLDAGADILTGGNHLFDQKEAIGLLESEKRFLRPANMTLITPGNGVFETITRNGDKIVTVHLIGQVNMPLIGENPFFYMDKLLTKYQLGKNVGAIIVDFHAEVTSEKNALGHYLDGRVSAVVGTHTHIPTSDERILANGTAFQTDLGMCGDYDSVIGMQKNIAEKFVKGYSACKISPSFGEATLCGAVIDVNEKTGLAVTISPVRIGGVLCQSSGI